MNVELTISMPGRPYHNVALDEGHEQKINKRLKELTSRPSEYRTVTLANFMAYLDSFLSCMDCLLTKFSSKKKQPDQVLIDYVDAVLKLVKETDIFICENRKLCNVFDAKPKEIDNETREDLLSVQEEGEKRMRTFIRQHVIQPPLEMPKKRIRRKL